MKDKVHPFGDKQFIGILKFFDKNKGFGYIVSNNYGMGNEKPFNKPMLSFYIDQNSIESSLDDHTLLLFKPTLNEDEKLNADFVKPLDKEEN